uniref:Elongin-C n=1 Tax=Parascaris univalens TaxID=6257 RepID=A0A915C5X6_PARUN
MSGITVHGGCEGPDAMYVKLISSDGHEFIIKKDLALTSGTIKAMLSGPGTYAENESNEVNFREIPKCANILLIKYAIRIARLRFPSS